MSVLASREPAPPPPGGAAPAAYMAELHALAQRQPELEPWLRPLGVALAALEAAPWAGLAPNPDPGRDAHAPLLQDARVSFDSREALSPIAQVLGEALGQAGRSVALAAAPHRLLAAAAAGDEEALARLAQQAGLEPAALAAAARIALLPLLHASRRALHERVPPGWSERYCPICGGAPALVEVRGLERRRALRCGGCGEAWPTEVLLCAFCGERDHDRLGSLVPEGREGQLRWVETCSSCRGYLKAFATLRGSLPEAVALQDAASLELDLVAAERGWARPAQAGFALRMRLQDLAPLPAPAAEAP